MQLSPVTLTVPAAPPVWPLHSTKDKHSLGPQLKVEQKGPEKPKECGWFQAASGFWKRIPRSVKAASGLNYLNNVVSISLHFCQNHSDQNHSAGMQP